MYQGLVVIENFEAWNDFFSKEKKIHLSKLPKGEYFENQGIVFKNATDGNKVKEHGIVKGDYVHQIKNHAPYGIKPLNTEQTIAFELLNNVNIPLVTLLGAAGSGKTLLSIANACHALKKGHIKKIIIAKSMTPVGKEIGFLKGSMEEKVTPWLGAFYDNFEKCGMNKEVIEKMIQEGKLEITPLTYIQGRSISNSIMIIDEIQNLTMDIIKQIITRAADNCRIFLLGDPAQRFEKGLLDLTNFVEKGKASPLVGHVNFLKSVRSELAEWAVNNL